MEEKEERQETRDKRRWMKTVGRGLREKGRKEIGKVGCRLRREKAGGRRQKNGEGRRKKKEAGGKKRGL